MCGIAGILALSPAASVQTAELRAMADCIRHRGPDEEGFLLDAAGRCGLAFRRLSIIDVAAGHQPISNETGDVHVVFNGEIYNFRALRRELEQHGHSFRTHSDSEVIVHAYEQYGGGCFERFAGMFAIAIWDQRQGLLSLGRDRLGKKPLVYAVHHDRLLFASEAKSILALPEAPREIDAQSLHRYLLFQYVPAPHSIFRGFRKLPPGCWMQFRAHDARPSGPTAYWSVPQPPRFAGTYEGAKRRLEELLTAAVEKRLVSDVPLGAFLSGGVDSSVVVALMRKLGVSPLRTFSIGFEDARYDERAYARAVARMHQTEHHEHVVTPRAREIIDLLAWHYDEPMADSSAIPTYYVSHWARQSVTVALTGDGGDECFAGYDRYRAVEYAALADRVPGGPALAGALARLVPKGPAKSLRHRTARFLGALHHSPVRRYLDWMLIFTPEQLARGYRAEFSGAIDAQEPVSWFAAMFEAGRGSAAERAAWTDFHSYLPYDLLVKVDIASMACSLECRCPFLDHDLIEFALSLPLGWRIGRRGGKHILKDWARPLLPPALHRRGKMGFGVPVGDWFRRELRELLNDHLLDPHGLCATVFRAEYLRELIDAHQAGRANHAHRLWSLLMLEHWNRRWTPVHPVSRGP